MLEDFVFACNLDSTNSILSCPAEVGSSKLPAFEVAYCCLRWKGRADTTVRSWVRSEGHQECWEILRYPWFFTPSHINLRSILHWGAICKPASSRVLIMQNFRLWTSLSSTEVHADSSESRLYKFWYLVSAWFTCACEAHLFHTWFLISATHGLRILQLSFCSAFLILALQNVRWQWKASRLWKERR